MITFSDLFANETDRYTDFLPSTTQSSDEIVRQYNNSYGVFTDTHMSRLENGDYVITGSLCRDHQLFCTFVCSLSFGLGTFFRPGGGEPISLNDFLRKYGKIWRLTMLNGDCVCYITQDFALTGVPEVTAESVVNGRKTPVALWTIFRSEYGYYNINDFISIVESGYISTLYFLPFPFLTTYAAPSTKSSGKLKFSTLLSITLIRCLP